MTVTFGYVAYPSVCRLKRSCTPTQPVKILGIVSTPFGTLAIRWPFGKNFTEVVPREPLRRGRRRSTQEG